MANSDASVSTLNGILSSIAAKEALAMSVLRELKANLASFDKGKGRLAKRGRIFSENLGIQWQ